MKKTFISFIGTNDAGSFIGGEEGSILSIIREHKFNDIFLIYNISGRAGTYSYLEIAEKIKDVINNEKLITGTCYIENLEPENIADHTNVYTTLMDFLNKTFPEKARKGNEIFAGISSGTPAMQTAWVLIAESNTFLIQLLRGIESKHSKDGKRSSKVPLLTGMKEKLDKLKTYEKRLPSSDRNYSLVYDVRNLNDDQIRLAKEKHHILIYGETGTGKEELAFSIHSSSNRKGEIVPINCSGISEALLESELFGHERGAFTGADRKKDGIVKTHSGGTLFLDEINSMPLAIQAKLLRFINNGEFRALGSNETQKSEIRIIAATNQKLSHLVASGKFREDLYYRLRCFELEIPPLRDRLDQIPGLVSKLSKEALKLSKDSIKVLQSHKFYGNVRELKIIVDRLLFSHKDKEITSSDVQRVIDDLNPDVNIDPGLIVIPTELEGKAFDLVKQMLAKIAMEQKGNSKAAGELLGVTHTIAKKWANGEK